MLSIRLRLVFSTLHLPSTSLCHPQHVRACARYVVMSFLVREWRLRCRDPLVLYTWSGHSLVRRVLLRLLWTHNVGLSSLHVDLFGRLLRFTYLLDGYLVGRPVSHTYSTGTCSVALPRRLAQRGFGLVGKWAREVYGSCLGYPFPRYSTKCLIIISKFWIKKYEFKLYLKLTAK